MSNSNELEETTPKTPLMDRIKTVAEKSVPVAKVAALSSVAIFLVHESLNFKFMPYDEEK